MPSSYITKSDFKACLDCRTKLFYRKNRYPSTMDENDYLRFLADGGFMVEFLAKARFPDGIDLVDQRNPLEAFEQTKSLVERGDTVLFEAAAIAGPYYVRTDILRRQGPVLELIEVKSSSLGEDDGDGSPFLTQKGGVASRWREYLMDVAFQTHVLRLAFPGFQVRPYLCVVDKTQRVSEAETLERFRLLKSATDPKARPEVVYAGDARDLLTSKLVTIQCAEDAVNILMPEVVRRAEELAALLTEDGVVRKQEDIREHYRSCRVCEYRTPGNEPDGFSECWGALAHSEHHILELHRVGQMSPKNEPDRVSALLGRGSASILDLDEADLGKEGKWRDRRVMQWESLRAGGVEYLPTDLRLELMAHLREPGAPLYFLDFEACDIVLPHHAGLRPYERVAFQWSCHTLTADFTLRHDEWLNTERAFPNFRFACSLRQQLGDEGTVYVWSPYEQGTLKKILLQLPEWLSRAPDETLRLSGLTSREEVEALADWIERLLGPEDESGKHHSARIRDLHDLARSYYFHPVMGGRTSIKVVLPAVWSQNQRLWSYPAFQGYYRVGEDGLPMDPYKVLPALPLGDEEGGDDAVRDGTGAIRIYQDLIFAPDRTAQDRENLAKLLFQYCELDTAAMVMIWMHWIDWESLQAG